MLIRPLKGVKSFERTCASFHICYEFYPLCRVVDLRFNHCLRSSKTSVDVVNTGKIRVFKVKDWVIDREGTRR